MRLNMVVKEAGERQGKMTDWAVFQVVLEKQAELMEEVVKAVPGVSLEMTRAGNKFCLVGPGQLLPEGEVGVKIIFKKTETYRNFMDEVMRREEELKSA